MKKTFKQQIVALLFSMASTAFAQQTTEPFYDVSNVATDQPPGTLVRTSDYTNSRLVGTNNSRIMYLSVDPNGQTVATTAAVAIPKGTPPEGGWPVIAWAHGTVGVGKMCAPSMTDNLSKYGPYLQSWVDKGYAIVATDYSGLGTTGRHFYSNRESNARDVIESVRAASTAYPTLSKSFVVMGHSQGGLAAIGVAETIGDVNIAPLQYKGAIAIAPGTGLVQQYFRVIEQYGAQEATTMAYLMYFTATMKLITPGLEYTDEVSKEVAAMMPAAETQCLDELRNTLKATVTFPKSFINWSWPNNAALKKYAEKNQAGQRKLTGDLFITWGTGDQSISQSSLNTFIKPSCRNGSRIQFTPYAGATHSSVLLQSKPDMFAWVSQQFAGTYKARECGEAFSTLTDLKD